MRLSTLAATVVVALSTAALAQVARTPVEQKNAPTNAALPGNPVANTVASNTADTPSNGTATPPDSKTEPAAPPRR